MADSVPPLATAGKPLPKEESRMRAFRFLEGWSISHPLGIEGTGKDIVKLHLQVAALLGNSVEEKGRNRVALIPE